MGSMVSRGATAWKKANSAIVRTTGSVWFVTSRSPSLNASAARQNNAKLAVGPASDTAACQWRVRSRV